MLVRLELNSWPPAWQSGAHQPTEPPVRGVHSGLFEFSSHGIPVYVGRSCSYSSTIPTIVCEGQEVQCLNHAKQPLTLLSLSSHRCVVSFPCHFSSLIVSFNCPTLAFFKNSPIFVLCTFVPFSVHTEGSGYSKLRANPCSSANRLAPFTREMLPDFTACF